VEPAPLNVTGVPAAPVYDPLMIATGGLRRTGLPGVWPNWPRMTACASGVMVGAARPMNSVTVNCSGPLVSGVPLATQILPEGSIPRDEGADTEGLR
jgi:hypothetical protein